MRNFFSVDNLRCMAYHVRYRDWQYLGDHFRLRVLKRRK